MPISRILQPNPNDVFYHYCSVQTFQAICEHKKIRFSDINMLNDYYEARWSYRIFELAATELLNDKEISGKFVDLDKAFFDKVDAVIAPQQLFSLPTISSFSKEPDVLSQWRAYADNGRGVAVGFSSTVLKAMPITLLEVLYDQKQQVKEMKAALLTIHAIHMESKKDGPTSFGPKAREACQLLSFWKLGFKNPAFAEEKEVRCLHALKVEFQDGKLRLTDEGGESAGNSVPPQKVSYRVTPDGAIVAYVDIPIPSVEGIPQIKEVWLGPRNVNAPTNIACLMSECGLKDYSIRRSSASYR
jgi:hypothetical protein